MVAASVRNPALLLAEGEADSSPRQALFASLGYTWDETEGVVHPPDIGLSSEETMSARATLIRAWLELGLILEQRQSSLVISSLFAIG